MKFKRTTNATDKLDEFIAGADSQKEPPQKKGRTAVGTKFSKELGIKIRKKYPTYTLAKFIELALTTPIAHIKDEVLITIYDQAKWHNTSMSEFVRFKMGLSEAPQPKDPKEKEHQKNYIVFVSEAKKEKIRQIAESLEISILTYSDVKILATYELKDIFTFDELMQFKAEANNFDLDLDEYIAMRIRG
ncbi:Uncharacterised protein [Campylobacter hyointestinalis subsp. hyointestinalis]|uniref:Uncharacterized protein n=1 Tax=Campylobacter hyointestinalis subsp. hyointestinalis TaxID=91352 RepID=A0A0S4SPV0_CAMHY|nr:hypothetical protein [Campylobacter hyointestinalis]CUU87629.1 Uncharacterised protein [Campylobacter hyointestinalis subsp. hyointestinalis]